MNKIRKSSSILHNLSFALLLIVSPFFSFSQSNGFEVIRSLELLDQIYENLEKYYVDDIEAGNLSKVAIDAMLTELDQILRIIN